MQYALLIYNNEADAAAMTTAQQEAEFKGYMQFSQEVAAAKVMIGGEPLQPTATATTVRVRDGKTLTTDGPFAETKEQLGGFYLVDCKDLDEAIQWAAKIPGAAYGSVEIRPIMMIPKG